MALNMMLIILYFKGWRWKEKDPIVF